MKFLYKFSSRSRPDKFIQGVENIFINSRNKDFVILASLDTDDITMNNKEIMERISRYDNIIPIYGTSKNKVDAINRDLNMAWKFDVLVNFSDDMVFIQEGFDEIIEADMKKHFPKGDCLLHYPDQNQGENCMTMSIMDKQYYSRFNYIYHPDYESLECDVEAQEVGKLLGRYKFINTRLFNHHHPSFGQTPYDEQYIRTEGLDNRDIRDRDGATIERRRKNNFYLNIL